MWAKFEEKDENRQANFKVFFNIKKIMWIFYQKSFETLSHKQNIANGARRSLIEEYLQEKLSFMRCKYFMQVLNFILCDQIPAC